MNDVRMCDRAPNLVWKIREGFPEMVTLELRCNGNGVLTGPKGLEGLCRQRKQHIQMLRGRSQRSHQNSVGEQTNYKRLLISFNFY